MSPTIPMKPVIAESGIQKKDEERWIKACQWLTIDGRRRDYPMTEGFMLLSLYKILDVNGRTDANAAVWFQSRSMFKTSGEFHVAFLKQVLSESTGDKKRQQQIREILRLYQDAKLSIKTELHHKPSQPPKKSSPVLRLSQSFVREVKGEETPQTKTPAVLDVLAKPFGVVELNAEAKPFVIDEVTGPVYSAVATLMMAKMGYREGWGLGKAENGIREPHTMTIRSPGMAGLGYKGRR